jgi:prevent-host-death family protein
MKTVTTHEAKTHLSRLLKDVLRGETVIVTNGSVPVARLTAVEPVPPTRPPVGTVTSEPVALTDDAFAPLSDGELKEWGL